MEEKVQPTEHHNALSDKEEDQEGEAERRRELAEEEMAQAGQPQRLEEDPDQPQDEQQEEEELPEQEQPDGNALDRQRRHPQLVRTGSNYCLLAATACLMCSYIVVPFASICHLKGSP